MILRNHTRETLFLIFMSLTGCAGYAGDVKEIRSSLIAGDKIRALQMSNKSLEVDQANHYPVNIGGDNALLVLERGTIKQGLKNYHSSSLDFRVADKHLELLDLRNDTVGNIGKWLFSDDATVYKAPPHEMLLLHSLNILNYLALGDLESARVEARRLSIMQKFLRDNASEHEAQLGIGNYLAGFTFEMSKRREQALQHYDAALGAHHYPSLAKPIHRLSACEEQHGQHIKKLLEQTTNPENEPEPCVKDQGNTGTILVISTIGLAPHKEAIRLPIGAALVIAARANNGPRLGASDTAKANKLAAKGLLKWVMFPKMVKTKSPYTRVKVSIDGVVANTEEGENITALTLRAWNEVKGSMIAAAIVRMITRAVAGEVTNKVAEASGAASGLAFLAGLAMEGALTASDTPDTRSWVTLPSHILISRIDVPAGKHNVNIEIKGPTKTISLETVVNLDPGGFVVLPVETMK